MLAFGLVALALTHPSQASPQTEDLLAKGLALSRLSDYASAVTVLEMAVGLDPALPAAHRELTVLYSRLGRYEHAGAAYERARALAPIPGEEALRMGRALRKAGMWGEARLLLGTLVESDDARLELALLAMEEGRYEEASEILGPVSSRLGTASAHFEHARVLEALGQTERSIEAYRIALDLSPYHRAARFRLGTLLLRTGNTRAGRRLLQGYEPFRIWDRQVKVLKAQISSGALAAEDRKRKTLLLVDLLLDGNALDEATGVIESGLIDFPEEARFEVARARWLLLSSESEDALRLLGSVLEKDASLPEAYWVLAQLHMRQRRPREALAAYETLIPLWPDAPAKIHLEIGTAYAMAGRLPAAISHFERALVSEPNLPRAHADLGLALAMTGHTDEAEAHYREALRVHPELVAAQQGLGSLFLERGQTLEAIALFQSSVELRPNVPVLRRNLANALQRAGRVEEAKAELERARELEARQRK